MCMSLEGFVAQPDDNPAELFDWYWGGDVVVPSAQEGMSFSVDAASAPMLAELTSGCGAVVAGRRLFDQTDGWGDNHPTGAPVVVVTHRPPPDDAAERSRGRRSTQASRRRSPLRGGSPVNGSSRLPALTSSSRPST